MTQPKYALHELGGRKYYDPTGEFGEDGKPLDRDKFTSVTSAIGCLNKPALVKWSANCAIGNAIGAIESDPLILEDIEEVINMLNESKGASDDMKNIAAHTGDLVHAYIDNIIKSQCEKSTDRLVYYFDKDGASKFICDYLIVEHIAAPWDYDRDKFDACMVAFSKWTREFEVVPVLAEATIYNRQFMYAGSVDLIAYVNGILSIIDFKTSKSIYPEVALQLTAYKNGEYIVNDYSRITLDELFGEDEAECCVLHLRPTERYTYRMVNSSFRTFGSFVDCLNITQDWYGNGSKQTLGTILKPLNQ